jgi:MYXO-CTERM domain-containing protein
VGTPNGSKLAAALAANPPAVAEVTMDGGSATNGDDDAGAHSYVPTTTVRTTCALVAAPGPLPSGHLLFAVGGLASLALWRRRSRAT